MQGRPLNPQTRREILRLAALRSIDGRQLWTYAAISRQLGLDGRTVGKVVRDAGLSDRLDDVLGGPRSYC